MSWGRPRTLRSGLVLAVMAAAVAPWLAAPSPTVAATSSPTITACGYSTPTGVDTTSCVPLASAITTAEAEDGVVAIRMLPGDYCPITLDHLGQSEQTALSVELEGAGFGGFAADAQPTLAGPEADLSSFVWQQTACGDVPASGAAVTIPMWVAGQVTLSDLSVMSVSGGPSIGVAGTVATFALRDVEIDGFATGVSSYPYDVPEAHQFGSVSITASALIDDAVAATVDGPATITSTTMSGSSTVAVNDDSTLIGNLTLSDDTITHSSLGIDDPGAVVANNTIVADNGGLDCSAQTANWESGGSGGSLGSSGHNLAGPTCASLAATDVPGAGVTLGQPGLNGGPTMSILPPTAAVSFGDPTSCVTSDQREYVRAATDPCDIGSVDSTGNGEVRPTINSSLNFAAVNLDDPPPGGTLQVSNSGGGLMEISGASGTGDLQVVSDTCVGVLTIGPETDVCQIGFHLTLGARGPLSGALIIAGLGDTPATTTIQDSGLAVDPPGVPTDVRVVSAPKNQVKVSWTSPADDGGAPVVSYEVFSSDILTNPANSAYEYEGLAASGQTSLVFRPSQGAGTYGFVVQAANSGAASDYSASSPSVDVPLDTFSLSVGSSTTIDPGDAVVLTTTLLDTDTGVPLAYRFVSLLASAAGGPFVVVKAKQGKLDGVSTITVKPRISTRYEWRWMGDDSSSPATSAIQTVAVRPTLTVAATPKSVKHGKATSIYGKVAPNADGDVAVLQQRVNGVWKTTAHTDTVAKQKLPVGGATASAYLFTVKEAKAGTYSFRVSHRASVRCAVGYSAAVTVRVT
jgi:hypothetical protein